MLATASSPIEALKSHAALVSALADRGWVLDTGCSHYICRNKELFSSLREVHDPIELNGVGGTSPILQVGDVELLLLCGRTQVQITLADNRLFPESPAKLFSVYCLMKVHAQSQS